MKILAPVGLGLDPAVVPPPMRLVTFDPEQAIPAEHEDAVALIVWGIPPQKLREAASRLRDLRWVQTLSAGTEAAVNAGFAEDVVITSGSSLHDRPVAEHALALILAAARRLHVLVRAQIGHRWAQELGGPQPEPSPGVFTTLRGARVLIWGFGSIARTLAPLLVSLGATVTGAASRAREDGDYRVIGPESVTAELARTDVVVMILPDRPSTFHLLSAELIALLPAHSWVVNVGRGSTIDEDALIRALHERRIGGAALDVVSEEPLASGSALWDLPNVIITPHAAGGRPLGAAELIRANAARFIAGESLTNQVSRSAP